MRIIKAQEFFPARGGAKGPPEPHVLNAPGAVAGGGHSAPFRRSPLRRGSTPPHGGKSRKVHRLEMRKITKYFPDVNALSDVDFRLMKGEVHAIMGQNGDPPAAGRAAAGTEAGDPTPAPQLGRGTRSGGGEWMSLQAKKGTPGITG